MISKEFDLFCFYKYPQIKWFYFLFNKTLNSQRKNFASLSLREEETKLSGSGKISRTVRKDKKKLKCEMIRYKMQDDATN